MKLQDLLKNVEKYTLLEKEDRCLLVSQDFYIYTHGSVRDNRLRFLIVRKNKLIMNILELIAKNNGNFFRWQGETSWLYYYYEQLPNVCTYLVYLYLFDCTIKINENKNKK